MVSDKQRAAYERQKAKRLALQKTREAKLLADHQAIVARTQKRGRIMGIKKTPPAPIPVRRPGIDDKAWWSKPEARALITAQLAHPKLPVPMMCPACGGHRIRPQSWRSERVALWWCPEDWSKSVIMTGCGHRWIFDPDKPPDASQSSLEARTAFKPARMHYEPDWLSEAPESDPYEDGPGFD